MRAATTTGRSSEDQQRLCLFSPFRYVRLTATNRSVRNGLSRNGVSVAFRRRGAFEAAYDVEGDGPSFRFLSQADVLDRTVDL